MMNVVAEKRLLSLSVWGILSLAAYSVTEGRERIVTLS
jgi:hypothetical protein